MSSTINVILVDAIVRAHKYSLELKYKFPISIRRLNEEPINSFSSKKKYEEL